MFKEHITTFVLCILTLDSGAVSVSLDRDRIDSLSKNKIHSIKRRAVTSSHNVTSFEQNFNVTLGEVGLTIIHWNSYFVGLKSYTYSGIQHNTTEPIDSSNDVDSYQTYTLTNLQPVTLKGYADNTEQRWTKIEALAVTTNLGDQGCPTLGSPDLNNNGQQYIFSDYYNKGSTRAHVKTCTWSIPAPPTGSVTVVNVIYYNMTSSENLQVTGSLNNTANNKAYNSTETDSLGIVHYDSQVIIQYNRTAAVNNVDKPAFRIMLYHVQKVQNKPCSLPYHDKVYSEKNMTFTNIVPKNQYAANQYCSWRVTVPKNANFTFCYNDCNFGRFSGDELTVEVPGRTYHNYQPTACFTADKKANDYNATFVWESDGKFEYNGFTVKYTIKDGSEMLSSKTATILLLFCVVFRITV